MLPLSNPRFELVRKVGEDAFGAVSIGRDLRDASDVAGKVLHGSTARSTLAFEREAALLSALSHPNIVRYIAHGRTPAGSGISSWSGSPERRSRVVCRAARFPCTMWP